MAAIAVDFDGNAYETKPTFEDNYGNDIKWLMLSRQSNGQCFIILFFHDWFEKNYDNAITGARGNNEQKDDTRLG